MEQRIGAEQILAGHAIGQDVSHNGCRSGFDSIVVTGIQDVAYGSYGRLFFPGAE